MEKSSKILLIYIVLSLLIRIYLFLKIGTIFGADVGRFAIISHALYLKKEVTPNLQPYDMATGFFYFPGNFLLPLVFEYLGINPIDTITFFSFLFSFLSTLVFYKIATKFLDREEAINAFFFYSFIFDIVLIFALFGVFPYAFASFFFLICCLVSLEIFFENKKNVFLLTLGILGIFSFHLYLLFPLILFLFSLFTYEYVNTGKFKKSKFVVTECLKSLILVLIILSPFFLLFCKYLPISFFKENKVDLLSFASGREKFTLFGKFQSLFFVSYIGTMLSGIFVICFILFLFSLGRLIRDRKIILVYFFVYLTIYSILVFYELNLLRATSFFWIIYSVVLALYLKNPYLNLAILIVFFFVQSPSILYMMNILSQKEQVMMVPWVYFPDYFKATDFIKKNTSENSVFLIDGGGAGCTGASSSYGERIFPLTSRRIFYFTNYCWAEYNRTEYRKRVDIFKRISTNPDDSGALTELSKYNVTHVFIGPSDISLDSNLFLNSTKYELIYDENKFQIFEIK